MGTDNDNLATTMQLMIKGQLQSAQAVRALAATAWLTCLLPHSAAAVVAALAAGTTYSETVGQRGVGHGLGPPHPHIALAAVEALRNVAGLDEDSKTALNLISQYLNAAGAQVTARLFTHFRVTPCFQKNDEDKRYKLNYTVNPLFIGLPSPLTPSTVAAAIASALVADGGVYKDGQAPAGQLERQLQKALRTFTRDS